MIGISNSKCQINNEKENAFTKMQEVVGEIATLVACFFCPTNGFALCEAVFFCFVFAWLIKLIGAEASFREFVNFYLFIYLFFQM